MDADNARDGDRDLVIDLLDCDPSRFANLDLIDKPTPVKFPSPSLRSPK
jgi:hypothetical protein